MLMEKRRGFQVTVGIIAVAVTGLLYWQIREAIPQSAAAAQIALPFLSAGAIAGFSRLLTLLLPPLLAKYFPSLDSESAA